MVGHSGTVRRDEGGVSHGSILRDIHFSYMHGVPAQRSTHVAVGAATRRPPNRHRHLPQSWRLSTVMMLHVCVDDATSTH